MGQPRVCVLTSSFPDSPGDGAGVFVREQVQRLSLGTSVDVVYPSRCPAVEYVDEAFTRRRVGYPFKSSAMSQVRGAESLRALAVCARMAVATRLQPDYDLYHAYWAIPSGFVARCVKGRRPLVVTLCGSDVNVFGSRRGFREAVWWALSGATRVIAVSHHLLDRAVDLGLNPAKATVIPSGVDTRTFTPITDKQYARTKLGLPDGFLCVSVGNLFRNKRVDRLIRAMARVSRHAPCTLVVIGDGPDRESLQTLSAESGCDAVFLGRLPHEQVARVVGCCDAFVMASRSEGLPTSAQEAMCCGIPIVACDVGGLREIVINGVTGFLVRDEVGMSRMLHHLVEHKELTSDMGTRAREFARSELSVESSVASTLKVYEVALEVSRRRGSVLRRSFGSTHSCVT